MAPYRYAISATLLICVLILSYHLIRLIRLGAPRDFSRQAGDLKSAIVYSFVGAMSPFKKESAYLHLPTYLAGLCYHAGSFTSIVLFFLFFFEITFEGVLHTVVAGFLLLSAFSGAGILLKRITQKKLRSLSNPDDYISNSLVTMFQFSTFGMLIDGTFAPVYSLCVCLLLLYIPIGKLKHMLYFFAARYHLGLFYGWRGIWPGGRG